MKELTRINQDTILAALRFAQDSMNNEPEEFHNMVHFSDHADDELPSQDDIDTLCESINTSSLVVGSSANIQAHWMAGREQGIWETIAKLAAENKELAILVAKQMEVGTSNLHEFDWENFSDIFGSKEAFLAALESEQ